METEAPPRCRNNWRPRQAEKTPQKTRVCRQWSCTFSNCRRSPDASSNYPLAHGLVHVRLLFLAQSFDARKLSAREKFQRSPTTGGNMRDLIRQAGLVDGSNRVTAAHNGGCPAIRGTCHSFSDRQRALCK